MSQRSAEEILSELQRVTEEAVNQLNLLQEEELFRLAETRERLVNEFQCHKARMTQQNREQIEYILNFDKMIVERMEFLKNEAGAWLQRRGSAKQQLNAYQQQYAADSWFIDHRN
ncbi:hypothetical protein [Paenibacillus sp. AD87]|jgi:hypothetical protein|uniref:hypothetical protein n=1 Tax=Paenibacillus sp. AD87 TaxID=1528787 RepID=UPI0007E35D79|nr:hypothetical protein [Paenibacillus sp. AD87]OAX46338.1 hypothetical protein gpAD87_27950 [Paenibacillus sp. AD87]